MTISNQEMAKSMFSILSSNETEEMQENQFAELIKDTDKVNLFRNTGIHFFNELKAVNSELAPMLTDKLFVNLMMNEVIVPFEEGFLEVKVDVVKAYFDYLETQNLEDAFKRKIIDSIADTVSYLKVYNLSDSQTQESKDYYERHAEEITKWKKSGSRLLNSQPQTEETHKEALKKHTDSISPALNKKNKPI